MKDSVQTSKQKRRRPSPKQPRATHMFSYPLTYENLNGKLQPALYTISVSSASVSAKLSSLIDVVNSVNLVLIEEWKR